MIIKSVLETARNLTDCAHVGDLEQEVESLRRRLSLEILQYKPITIGLDVLDNEFILGKTGLLWEQVQLYSLFNNFPIMAEIRNSTGAIDWSLRANRDADIYDKLGLLRQIGFPADLRTIAIRGPAQGLGLLHYTTGDKAKRDERYFAELEIGLLYFGNRLQGSFSRIRLGSGKAHIQLSEREAQALSYAAYGMKSKEIAFAMRISEVTVNTYLKHARGKLKATNTIQAAARAISQGMITVR